AAGKTVTLGGGTINGTLSGLGSIEVAGDVELGATGKLTTGALAVESGTFSIGSKGLALSAKNSILTVNGGVVDSEGKLSTNELQMTGGEISIDTAKAMSLDIKGKTTSSLVDNGRISVAGKMSVAGNLERAGASSIRLYDPSGKNKAMPLAVKGSLTLGSGSTLTLSGALSAKDMVLEGGTINLTGTKLATIKVGNSLTLNAATDINYNFAVTQKDVDKGKAFKILTFKSSNLQGQDVESLYNLLGLSEEYCTLVWDKKQTSLSLKVTDLEGWNEAKVSDEDAKASVPAAVAALVNPALPDYSGVADALVQANWGLVESSRAFVNTIANRSMAVQLGSGERAVWASAIAGSSRRSSSGTHGGADTNITGGAIGMETQVGEGSLLGMALGNSWTRVSAHNYGTIKQDTTHLGLYGQTNWNKLSADWSAAYGRSESKVNGSDWSQRAIQLDGRLSYNHALSETVLLRGFGGVQYYASDSARVDGLDTGEVQNLRGEIGVGIVRSTQKSSVYAELALHQDRVRDNPEVRSPFGQRYHGTNPGRTGINLTIGGSYALSDQWSVNASYTAEVVENANAHSVNVGATYKF
ncbi:MAG: autotransporter outer membrane beta-barrel domain-containing protein, partial [Akkermansia sp.]|nr:autotransporter outer membrane beta-barrel domain-containing protein [Akkermansia sp.]